MNKEELKEQSPPQENSAKIGLLVFCEQVLMDQTHFVDCYTMIQQTIVFYFADTLKEKDTCLIDAKGVVH